MSSTVAMITAYVAVIAVILTAWTLRNENLIRADVGVGYWLGIVGGSLMLLLLIYPLRKRVRALSVLGSVRFWFRTHMIFGILGPVLVVLHSNFNLGSLNGRIALFCTLVVAGSGILGRYLYAKIHYGMYGHKATLESLQADMVTGAGDPGGLPIVKLINEHLVPHERAVMSRSRRVLPSLLGMAAAPLTARRLSRKLDRIVAEAIEQHTGSAPALAPHRERLLASAREYLSRRLVTYRKFAQLRGCERLFSLWHVVHFPLFLVMVAAAIIHVVAVHAY
ncbi:MAG: hypothetical protein PVH91_03090 [Pseudomonadales bacterium]|jgi:hypothetical protein